MLHRRRDTEFQRNSSLTRTCYPAPGKPGARTAAAHLHASPAGQLGEVAHHDLRGRWGDTARAHLVAALPPRMSACSAPQLHCSTQPRAPTLVVSVLPAPDSPVMSTLCDCWNATIYGREGP